LLVNQWAPATNKYLPYVDFQSPMQGSVSAKIQNGKLKVQLQPGTLKVTSTFRNEFSKFRRVKAWIANSVLGSRVASYLASQPFEVEVPQWEIGEGVHLNMRDVQVWKQSFRIPLEFKNSK
jgi:hypothetical protein